MVNITCRIPTEDDLMALATALRLTDIDELQVVTDLPILCAIRASIINSHEHYCWAYHADGRLLCLAGCTRSGNPWLLATDELDHYPQRLTQAARMRVCMMLEQWPILSNVIDVRQKMTIRWLKTIGFSFKETFEIKPGLPVIRFERVRDERIDSDNSERSPF